MSNKHYEERYYAREEMTDDYDDHRRSSSRGRSTSRSRRRAPPQEEQYYRQRMNRSGSGSSISSMSDYEYRTQCSGERPMVRVPRDVIRAPTPPPVIQRVVERAPTPEPDIVERVIVRPQAQQLIERIIERPRTPPPKIINKEICEPAPPPIVRTRYYFNKLWLKNYSTKLTQLFLNRIVKVDHSPRHYANSQPMRYAQEGVRTGLSNYGLDYDYDNSYSTSYSTTELFQPSNGYNQYMSSMQAYPQTQQITQVQSYPVGPSQYQMPAQNGYANSNYGGYTYGYRPNVMQGYSSGQMSQMGQMPSNIVYPRQY